MRLTFNICVGVSGVVVDVVVLIGIGLFININEYINTCDTAIYLDELIFLFSIRLNL